MHDLHRLRPITVQTFIGRYSYRGFTSITAFHQSKYYRFSSDPFFIVLVANPFTTHFDNALWFYVFLWTNQIFFIDSMASSANPKSRMNRENNGYIWSPTHIAYRTPFILFLRFSVTVVIPTLPHSIDFIYFYRIMRFEMPKDFTAM